MISVAKGNHAFISMPGLGNMLSLLKRASGKPGSWRSHSPEAFQSCWFSKSTVENSIRFPINGESLEMTLANCTA